MQLKALLRAAVLLATMAPLATDVAGQQKNPKNQPNQPTPAQPQDYYNIQAKRNLTAKLLAFDDANHTISVRIDFFQWVPNPAYKPNTGAQNALVADYNRLQQEQQRLAAAANRKPTAADWQHYQNALSLQNRIAADMARANSFDPKNPPFIKLDQFKDFDLDLQPNVALRKMFLPQEYDDTGNVKEYTKEQITELRGKNEPKGSYAAVPSDFHAGQGVWVYLARPKTDNGNAAEKKDEAKDNTMPRPAVKMLVAFDNNTAATPTTDSPKKKKKN
jgi:hypothetical protein